MREAHADRSTWSESREENSLNQKKAEKRTGGLEQSGAGSAFYWLGRVGLREGEFPWKDEGPREAEKGVKTVKRNWKIR